MKNKNTNNGIFYASSIIAAAAILIAAGVTGSALLTPQQVLASVDNTIEAEERVAVGGILDGNLTVSVNQFSPAAVEIQTGETVTFYAPDNSTEVHNVIFDMSNGSIISGNELPFILPQGADPEQQLELAPPFNFGESIIQEQQPDGRQAIITLNKAAYYPTVADQENNTRYLMDVEELQQAIEQAMQELTAPQLSANYTMNGTETIVSSGIILDVMGFGGPPTEEEETAAADMTTSTNATDTNATTTEAATSPIPPAEIGQENATTEVAEEVDIPPVYPFLNSFTLTFEQPGIYEYFCTFHPGMFGIVTVAGEEGEAANMTVTTDATDTNATAAEQEGEEEQQQQQQQQQTTPTVPPAPNPLFE